MSPADSGKLLGGRNGSPGIWRLTRVPIGAICLAFLYECSFLGCSPLILAVRLPIDIDVYRGEGMIARIPNALNPGFSVDFEPFFLSTPLARVYNIADLPTPRHHSPYEVALVVDLTTAEDANWPRVPTWLTTPGIGTLAFRVISGTGGVLIEGRADVSDLHWQRFINDMPYGTPRYIRDACYQKWVFPSLQRSAASLVPTSLEVSYTPGSGSVARSAKVRIMAGGLE